ncbi:MAG: hypothetical protein LBQ47_05850 [Endomicrobium sp.]|jgi:hypothetical protein|nr:hypothetical protein [Endomicrobium sp.]
MPIPTLSSDFANNADLYNNAQRASPDYVAANTINGSQQSIGQGIGGNFSIISDAAQFGFNSIFGAFTKPKAANLKAAEIEGNAELQKIANDFNAAELKRYGRDLLETSLKSYLQELSRAKSFVGTQKAAMSAGGSWSGSTFDAFIDDSIGKVNEDINNKSESVNKELAGIYLQADMLNLQSEVNLKMAKAQAKGIRSEGEMAGILSIFGLG